MRSRDDTESVGREQAETVKSRTIRSAKSTLDSVKAE